MNSRFFGNGKLRKSKDLSDPVEQFLTAAEEGDLESMERLLNGNPDLLMVRSMSD